MALPIPSPKAARPQAALQRSENRDQRTDPAWAGSALPSLSGAAFCDPCPTLHDSRGRRSEVRKGPDPGRHDARRISRLFSDLCSLSSELLPWPGGHSAGAPPDPIPNSAVKPRRAQGTAVLTVGERVVARPSQQFFPEFRGQRSEIRDQMAEDKARAPPPAAALDRPALARTDRSVCLLSLSRLASARQGPTPVF
jgi:hypothetical protein